MLLNTRFCGLNGKVPEHSVFSKNRKRRFNNSTIFKDIFNDIVKMCIEKGIVTGDKVVCDGSFIPANVSISSTIEVEEKTIKNTVNYLEELDKELEKHKGYKKSKGIEVTKKLFRSKTDTDCRYVNRGSKKGLGYLAEVSVDTDHGIITGIDPYPANKRESDIILSHLKVQMAKTGLKIKSVALDKGYDVGAVHRGLEILGIKGYCSSIKPISSAEKQGFNYNYHKDSYLCPEGNELPFSRLAFKKKDQNYTRVYSRKRDSCLNCDKCQECLPKIGMKEIFTSAFHPAYYKNILRTATQMYKKIRILRNIWSEGTFAVLKREHNLKRAQKEVLKTLQKRVFFLL
jgi:hypothetical protein